MQIERRPAPALRPFVSSYVGYALDGFPAGVHLGTPSQALTAVVSFPDPLDLVGAPGCVSPDGRFPTVASGLTSRSVAIRHDGRQHGVQISLTPLGARALYGMPAAALVDTLVPWGDLLGGLGDELIDRLATASGGWADRFTQLDDVLLRCLERQAEGRHGVQQVRPEVKETWRRLVAAQGRLEVGTIATDVGWSRRHLSEQFRRELGLTPKLAARVLRFEHARQLAGEPGPPSWADISAVAGYADQAHLVRDWREFTGCSPTAWQRGEVLGTAT